MVNMEHGRAVHAGLQTVNTSVHGISSQMTLAKNLDGLTYSVVEILRVRNILGLYCTSEFQTEKQVEGLQEMSCP